MSCYQTHASILTLSHTILWQRVNDLQNVFKRDILAVKMFREVYQDGASSLDTVDLVLEAANLGNHGCL